MATHYIIHIETKHIIKKITLMQIVPSEKEFQV